MDTQQVAPNHLDPNRRNRRLESWILESTDPKGRKLYWAGLDSADFCEDPDDAVWFVRRQDADEVRLGILYDIADDLRVTGHTTVNVNFYDK